MGNKIEQLTTDVYNDVFQTVEKKYLNQAKSFTTWIKTLKELREEDTYINANQEERLKMARVLGFKPNHLALASNSDKIIAKRALRDAEIRFEKLKANIKRILVDTHAVSVVNVSEKSDKSVLKFAITSEQGAEFMLRIVTTPATRSRYDNVVRTTLDVTNNQ
ncbi:hypothetical protein [Photobacterium damselae]|uniref:hypothetical protein n=1 Tax=Photobacterium damselae TaxID=38293 RepID=UPI001F1715F8|nr:hypothetical protein [Photobacterium damselae]UKA05058.1 hypothetical protein IHC89_22690 [Photobacterium damselae subsp. damselae]